VCLYNLDRLKEQSDYLRNRGILVICIFNSPPDAVARWVDGQVKTPFLLLGDPKFKVYDLYGAEYSVRGIWEPTVWCVKNFGSLKKLGVKPVTPGKIGKKPLRKMRLKPADFLIDEEGQVVDVHYAEKFSDAISFERIDAFVPENMKCTCDSKDCLSSQCRKNYKEIQENSFIFGMDD